MRRSLISSIERWDPKRDVSAAVLPFYGSETALPGPTGLCQMAISELLPETGRYECILRAKTRIPAHPIAGHDTEALKVIDRRS